jgi:hypothetical protein
MNSNPEPQDDLDVDTVEAVLSGAQPSGDPALDHTIDGLRSLVTSAPDPSGELARLLGSAVVPSVADEVGRRRQSSARHVATGTTVVAGILLASATAAAAMGGLGGPEHPTAPTPHRLVVPRPLQETPHPMGTTPTQLPSLPVAVPEATHEGSDPAIVRLDDAAPAEGPRRSRSDEGDERDDERQDTTHDEGRDTSPGTTPQTSDDSDEHSSSTGDGEDDEDSTSSSSGDGNDGEQASDSGSDGDSDGDSDGSSSGTGSGHGGESVATL